MECSREREKRKDFRTFLCLKVAKSKQRRVRKSRGGKRKLERPARKEGEERCFKAGAVQGLLRCRGGVG